MPSKPLDTGDNGFPIDGQKQTYDVGVPDSQAAQGYGAYQPGVDVSKGFQNDDGTPKDLSNPTKKTLAQYLSKVTMGKEGSTQVPNRYPVDGTNTTTSTTDSTGNPAPLETPPANADTFAGAAEATFDYPTQQYPTLAPLIKKGKANNGNVDGNDLLPGVPGNSTYTANPGNLTGDGTNPQPLPGHPDTSQSIINPYTSAVLKSNRFSSAAAAFASTDVASPNPAYDPTFTQQGKLGEYDSQATVVKAGQLASIGPLLTLRATTTAGATAPGADPNSDSLQASALVPGPAQLAVTRINQEVLLARDILSQLTTSEVPTSDIISPGAQSWGQLNDPNDPYSGTDALGMLTLSIALTAGLTLVIDLLTTMLGAITPQVKQPTHDANGRYTLGQYYANSKTGTQGPGGVGGISAISRLNFSAMLGINPTNYPFQLAMQTGFNAFFGLPQGANIGGQLLGSVTSSTDSPQFNVIVARALIRSGLTISDALKKIGGNAMTAINAVLSLVDTIRSSKIISALNVWATLGDSILSVPNDFSDPSTNGIVKVSVMDTKDDALANAVSKNRLRGSLKLAWASNRAPATVLLPSSIFAANFAVKNMGQMSPFIGVQEDQRSRVNVKVTKSTDHGRISPADAQAFEQSLDAEYVPFSFHDVRTNEIVSFHAFLAQLTDDFQAQYEKVDAFGRGEPVRIYKSTERRISLAFYIAATSVPDFDEMWVKINKLVTLVYPQYTQGQTVTDPTGNQYIFTQPFTQLVGSSPLVRIRLGNLFHTNYSRFGLARLFGLGNTSKGNTFTLDGETLQNTDKFDDSIITSIQTKIRHAQQTPNLETYFFSAGNWLYYDDSGSGTGINLSPPTTPGLSSGQQGPKFAPDLSNAFTNDFYIAKAKKLNPNNPLEMICTIEANPDADFMKKNAQTIPKMDQFFNNNDLPTMKIVGGTYSIPVTALTPTKANLTNIAGDLSSISDLVSAQNGFVDKLTTFMDPANNAVVKSFEDVGGKGLAGFIEQMAFDWYDKVTWETMPGRTAPKLCKVTVTFSPVHDISPGIDHLGFNRAPVYPVGVLSQDYGGGPIPPTNDSRSS